MALVLAAGSTVWALNLRSELDAQNTRIASLSERANNYARVTAVLQAADTQIRVLEGTGEAPKGFGRVYIDPDTSEGMLMVRNLPPLPQGKVYQLWVARADGQRESAAHFIATGLEMRQEHRRCDIAPERLQNLDNGWK